MMSVPPSALSRGSALSSPGQSSEPRRARVLALPSEFDTESLACAAVRAGAELVVASDAGQARTLALTQEFCVIVAPDAGPGDARLSELASLYALHPGVSIVLCRGLTEMVRLPLAGDLAQAVAGSVGRKASSDELYGALRRALQFARVRAGLGLEPHSLRVLLVARKPTQVRVARLLESCSLDILLRRAGSIEAALAALGHRSFDAVLTELGLPDGVGLDAVHRLARANPKGPTLALLARDDAGIAHCVLSIGAQDTLLLDGLQPLPLERALSKACVRHQVQVQFNLRCLHDDLTGLAKRTLFIERVANAVARSRRKSNSCAVLYIDVDRFKRINDTWGHEAGDIVLRAVSQRLCGAVREYDTVARLGGDEFAILLDNLEDPQEAEWVTQRVFAALAAPISINGQPLQVTASMGISVFSGGEGGLEDLVRNADQAMYEAKRRGRNTYSVAPPPQSNAPTCQTPLAAEAVGG